MLKLDKLANKMTLDLRLQFNFFLISFFCRLFKQKILLNIDKNLEKEACMTLKNQ